MRREIRVLTPEELDEEWSDPRVPIWSFYINERTLEDCVLTEDGYIATYDTVDVKQTTSYTYVCPSGTDKVIDVEPGEYGVKPD